MSPLKWRINQFSDINECWVIASQRYPVLCTFSIGLHGTANHLNCLSMLDIAYPYANRERYVIHPEKSVIIKRILPRNHREKLTDWKLGDMKMSLYSNATHLGLTCSAVGETQVDIDDRISCARRTFYSLTSSGLYGTNGPSPAVCFRIYSLYVIPRLLYGLEYRNFTIF